MKNAIFLSLFVLLSFSNLKSQSTKDLFSLPGLSFIMDSKDDVGQVQFIDLFYVGDTVYNDLTLLHYKSKSLSSQYFYVDGEKVYKITDFEAPYENLLFDFGVSLGDTSLSFNNNVYVVSEIGTIQLNDGLNRKMITYALATAPSITYNIIDGVGYQKSGLLPPFSMYYSRTLKCLHSDQYDIILDETFSFEDCKKRSCFYPHSEFTIETHEENVAIDFNGTSQDSFLMTFGDGVYFDHFVDSYTYDEKGCYEISITVINECGEKSYSSMLYNYCMDDLWQKKSDLIFSDIHFINLNDGYAINSKKLFKTSNAGIDWQELELPPRDSEEIANISLFFKDKNHGVIVTSIPSTSTYPEILYTSNGGITWEGISNDKRYLRDAKISSTGDIYAFSSRSIYKTSDEGNTWNTFDISRGWIHSDVEISNNDVITVAELIDDGLYLDSHIFMSADNGITWKDIDMTFDRNIESIFFFDENVGFASMRGELYKTMDGGENWNVSYTYDEQLIATNISFSDLNHGVFQIGEAFYTTSDGGENWNVEFCSNDQYIRDIQSINGENYAALSSGFYKNEKNPDFDCTEIVSTYYTELEDLKIYPNPFVDEIYFDGKSNTKYQLKIYVQYNNQLF